MAVSTPLHYTFSATKTVTSQPVKKKSPHLRYTATNRNTAKLLTPAVNNIMLAKLLCCLPRLKGPFGAGLGRKIGLDPTLCASLMVNIESGSYL